MTTKAKAAPKPLMFGNLNRGMMPSGISRNFNKPTVKTVNKSSGIEVIIKIPTGAPAEIKPMPKPKSWVQQVSEW